MEREAVLVGIDVGTSKVCALIGEVSRDGRLTIMGHGTVPASGLKKGVVVNIDQTVRSIADAVERAERLSGWKIDRAFVGVGGQHVESLNSPGQVAVTAHHREVTREDVNRAIEVARAVSIPSNREVLHVERRGFTVDGQEGVKDPLGMSALRLEVETHIVTASATAVQNLTKCVAAAGVKIDELVVDVARLGRGGPDRDREGARRRGRRHRRRDDRPRAVPDGSPFHTAVLPVGGNNVTNDVAIGLKTSLQVAEELKIRHGTCDLRAVGEDEEISVSVLGEDAGRTVSRLEVCQIIEARMRETFELLAQRDAARPASGMLPAGIILTGGAAQLAGAAELAARCSRCRSGSPRRRASAGSSTRSSTPRYATAVGLLQWGAAGLGGGEPLRYESAPAGGGLGPHPRRAPEHLPVDRGRDATRARGPDRARSAGLTDLTAGLRAGSSPRSRTAGRPAVGLRRRTPPPASSIVELGAGSDDDLAGRPRPAAARATTAGATATARPATAPTTSLPLLASPSLTVPVVGGPAGPRDLAVDRAARPERATTPTRTVRLSFLAGLSRPHRRPPAPAHAAVPERHRRSAAVAGRRPGEACRRRDGRALYSAPTSAGPPHVARPRTRPTTRSHHAPTRAAGGERRCRCVPTPRTSR